MDEFSSRLENIQKRIEEAAQKSGRKAQDICLMAVSKNHDFSRVLEAKAAGLTVFGENRLQEAQEKHPLPEARDYRLELIGSLQSNKARKAARFFDAVQSVDSEKVLNLLQDEAQKLGKKLDICLEVNTSGEESKSGIRSKDVLDDLISKALGFENLRLRGLMTLGPLGGSEKEIRTAFASLRDSFESYKKYVPKDSWNVLSMGMSADFDLAIEEGSSLVRLGTLLFGERQYR